MSAPSAPQSLPVLDCPVCQLPADGNPCSRCGTDLTPIIRIAGLPAQWHGEAMELAASGRSAQALSKLAAATEMAPEELWLREELAGLFARQGLAGEARSVLEEVLAREPGRESAREKLRGLGASRAKDAVPVRPRRPWIWTAGISALLCAGLVLVIALTPRRPPEEPVAERLARVQKWVAESETARPLHLEVALQNGIIAVSGRVPTSLHHQVVSEGTQRAAGVPVLLDGLTVEPPAPLPTVTVKPGDSLWKIAQRQYGTAMVWSQLRDANPRSSRISPGDRLDLPVIPLKPRNATR